MTDAKKPSRVNGKFAKGVSGNPNGRPRQESAIIRKQLQQHSQAVIDKLLDKALNEGDTTALKLILDRIAPPLKPVSLPSGVTLPEGADFTDTAKAIIQQAVNGDMEPAEAIGLLNAIQMLKPVRQTNDYMNRRDSLSILDF